MTREEIYSRFEELDKRASLGGGVEKIEKQHAQGKMTAREPVSYTHLIQMNIAGVNVWRN